MSIAEAAEERRQETELVAYMVSLDCHEGRAVIPCMLVDALACGGGRKLHGGLLGMVGLFERRNEPLAGNSQKAFEFQTVGG